MGNTSSGDRMDQVDLSTKIIKDAYDRIKGSEHELLQIEHFERLIIAFPPDCRAALWRHFFRDVAAVSFPDFHAAFTSLEALRRDDDRLRFALSLARIHGVPQPTTAVPYIEAVLRWCSITAVIDASALADISATFVANFVPLEDDALPSEDSFVRWAGRNCPELAHDLCTSVTESMRFGIPAQPSLSDLETKLAGSALSQARLWLLSSCVSDAFKHNQRMAGGHVLNKFNLDKMGHVHKLFDTFTHGMSSNRFRNSVFDYEAPSLTLIEFKEQSFCLALDNPYKEHWNPYGGPDTKLFSLRPKFSLMLSGTNLFYSNFTTKAGKRCLGIGRNPTQAAVVEVDEGLSKGSVYGLVQELVRLEVWGCGRDPERLARRQAEVKEFEAKDASKARNRKFKAEAWEDSPDRHIMEWGGVNAKHSELAGPPEDEEEEEKK